MANININAKFLNRIDTKAAWSLANPVLLKGETGFESDTQMFKVGDGVSTWNSLPYSVDPTSANTANKIVARDGSGNFSAGVVDTASVKIGSGKMELKYNETTKSLDFIFT